MKRVRMKNIYAICTLVGILSVAVVSCTKKESSGPGEIPTGKNVKPIALNPESVANGEKIYNMMCVACHQSAGAGKAGFAPRLNSPDFLGIASDAFIKKTILDGRAGTAMIGYQAMPHVADHVDDVVAYIRHWQNDYANFKDYDVDWTKTISGSADEGRKSFRTYCSSCHGPNGGGYADGGSGPGIGLSGFLNAASDDYIKKTILIGRAGTAMKPFGHGRGLANISDSDINNVVAYMRSLAQ